MQAAQQPPGAPPAGAPRAPRALSPRRLEELQLARDPFVGAISCCVWGLFMTKLYARQLAWRDNLQWMGLVVAVLGIMVAWPLARPRSYARWRTPAVAALRVACFARPFAFSLRWFDMVAPGPSGATGAAGLVQDALQLCMASNVTLLVFSAVALHLPFRLHLAVQALNVALQTRFGLSPFCASRLMASAVMQERVAAAHGGLAVLAAPVTPFGVLLVPQDARHRCAAFLLLCWLLLGWLVPSLLLLPRQAGAGARAPAQGKAAAVAGAVGGTLEAWLRMLRFGSTQRRGGGGGGLPAVPRVVHAFFVVVAAWTCSCLAAEALL